MGRLDAFTDMTGQMNQVDLNKQNIQQIIDELNRNSDQLDSLNKGLNIIAKNTLAGTWDGTGGINSGLTLSAVHGFSQAPIFLASFTRSDRAGLVYPVPQWFYGGGGAFESRAYSYTDQANIFFNFASVAGGAPINFVFSYYIIQQPAQVPGV